MWCAGLGNPAGCPQPKTACEARRGELESLQATEANGWRKGIASGIGLPIPSPPTAVLLRTCTLALYFGIARRGIRPAFLSTLMTHLCFKALPYSAYRLLKMRPVFAPVGVRIVCDM